VSGGADSTFIIYPEGLDSLTVATDVNPETSPYLLLSGTLDFHEEQRRVDNDRTGADLRVPVTFWLAIKHTTREGMITAYNDLDQALANKQGGRIAFKPDGLGAGVLTTYYHYVKSPPPELLKRKNNRWDASPKADGYYTIYVDVQVLTYPIATSDPDNPVTLTDLATTIDNWVDPVEEWTNRLTVQAANVKGTMQALLRIMARPNPDSSQNLGRLIIFKRDEGTLSNFVSIYEAEDASVIYPSVAWTDIADSERGEGHYMRCLPSADANGVAQGLRFTITNPSDHKGRFAVFGVGLDDAYSLGVWTHQVKIKVGNAIQTGRSDREATDLHTWELIYVGEFELPPVPLSDAEGGYDTGPYIEWYSTRASGSSEFGLDALVLVWVSDSKLFPTALDVSCADEGGVTTSEKLLVENFFDDYGHVNELAHAIAQSDDDFKRALAVAPHGDFLTLSPTENTLLTFIQERVADVILDDNFESYKGSRWMFIADFETDETWSDDEGTHAADTTYEVEGAQGLSHTQGAVWTAITYKMIDLDLESEGRFSDGDFVTFMFHIAAGDVAKLGERGVYFHTDASNYFECIVALGAPSGGYNYEAVKKSDFDETLSPDWADITRVSVYTSHVSSAYTARWDYIRIEKADPDDADNPNATGTQWDFQPVGGRWTITEDVSDAGATLACLDIEAAVEKAALIDETTPADVKYRARVMIKKAGSYIGIVWRAGDDTLTAGTEDCYVAYIYPGSDELLIGAYENGSYGSAGTPSFTCDLDTWYVIGVIVKGTTHRVYAVAASALSDDDDVFSAEYLQLEFSSGTFTSGKCGVMCYQALGRFDEVKLVSLQDKMIPADQITLSGKAIFRTIAPFVE